MESYFLTSFGHSLAFWLPYDKLLVWERTQVSKSNLTLMVPVWFCLLNHSIQQHRWEGTSKDHLVQFLAESRIAPFDLCRPVILILIINTPIDLFLTTTCWKDWDCSLGQHQGSFHSHRIPERWFYTRNWPRTSSQHCTRLCSCTWLYHHQSEAFLGSVLCPSW